MRYDSIIVVLRPDNEVDVPLNIVDLYTQLVANAMAISLEALRNYAQLSELFKLIFSFLNFKLRKCQAGDRYMR